MKKNISIMGCGWLGMELAKEMISNGYHVKGSTTSEKKLEELENNGAQPFHVVLNENGIEGNISGLLAQSEILIINIPPGLRKNPNKNHVSEIEHLIQNVEQTNIKHILYVSSTSVFKEETDFPIVNSKTIPNGDSKIAKQLIEIEKKLLNNSNFETTILRFGGLFGKDKHPAKYLAGKSEVSNPDAPINLIHRKDCIQIIKKMIEKDVWNISLNASYPHHPAKKEFYTDYCKNHRLEPPTFDNTEKSKGKIIDSSTLVQLLDYSFKQAP